MTEHHKKLPRTNFHIHSNFSDGKNSIVQIVLASLNLELDIIAITDHFTDSWKAKIIPTLDSPKKICDYIEEISRCKNFLFRSTNNLVLLTGIEIDLGSSDNYINSLIDPEKFDIILFEYLESIESINFVEEIMTSWKGQCDEDRFPLIVLAHFDPSLFTKEELEIVADFLNKNNVFYEFNSSYPEFLSSRYKIFFKNLLTKNIPISIGCDSHNIHNLYETNYVIQTLNQFGLMKNHLLFIDSVEIRLNP
ncbi:MAG: PHP domain-containing protein [Promethearchaeota archaeon]